MDFAGVPASDLSKALSLEGPATRSFVATLLILLTESLNVRLAVGIKEFLAALRPCGLAATPL